VIQRLFDILITGLALLIFSPLVIPLILLLRMTGEGEVFYLQERVGINGKIFSILKFATMLKDSPSIATGEITIRNDPRILPLGNFLRKTKINELPQLWNILVGDMSIVGPRPMVPKTFARYSEEAREVLCSVRPGLTGIGSVIFRDEERFLDGHKNPIAFYNEVIIPYKSSLELWYLRHKSFKLYFLIIFLTAWVIMFPTSELPRFILCDLPDRPHALDMVI